MKKRLTFLFIRLLLSLSIVTFIAPFGQQTALASSLAGTIAYVSSNQITGDEIHLIEPDGSNDSLLFRTNVPTSGVIDIQQLAWKPDASEIAFSSFHEASCSMYQSDIYAINPDGSNYHRVSGPPACGQAAGLPSGTVTVPVFNNTDYIGDLLIYFQGAPGPVKINLGSGESTLVTFNNVVDFGNKTQHAVWMAGEVRGLYPGASGDVQPGATLMTGELKITTGFEHYGFLWPTYTADGLKIASIFDLDWLFLVDAANQTMGQIGDRSSFSLPISTSLLAWGPAPERANQFLYEGWSNGNMILLGDKNGAQGQVLLNIDPTGIGKTLLGLAWLPDGSGFVYSVTEMVNYVDKADVWEYSFATRQSRRVTNVPKGFIRRISVSPDGQKIVYEYQPSGYWYEEYPVTDLWIMNRDGSEQSLLVQDARSPAWSPAPIPANNPVPVLTGINPGSANAGGAGFTLTASGNNFLNGSVVRWNGTALTTTFVNATTLTAQVQADKISAAGTASVTVYTPEPGGGESEAKTFTINSTVPTNPVPAMISLNPSVVGAGGPDFTLSVNGSHFLNVSVVRWGGLNLPTTYLNATTLTAQVTAAQIASTGPVSVTVFNPAPGGGESQALTLSIVNPEPVLSSINPSSATSGTAGFILTINGSRFTSESVVRWNGTDLASTYVSSTTLTAQVTAAQIASAGTAAVTVYNPAPGGGESTSKTFTINNPVVNNPVPVLNSLNPSSATSGGAGFTLTAYGSNFVSASVMRWNGLALATTYVNSATLTAQVPADKIAAAGTANVTVFNPAPGGGVSGSKTFTISNSGINNPVPTMTGMSPGKAAAGGAGLMMTVYGSHFINSSVVRWNGEALTTTYVNANTLTAQITADKIVFVAPVTVTVFNPAPGGGESASYNFSIYNPSPVMGSLSPNSANLGSPAFSLTVHGSSFVDTSVVRWNGMDLATTYVNATTLIAQVTAAQTASASLAGVSVFNPAPGGGESGKCRFTINNPVPVLTSTNPSSVNAGGAGFTLVVSGNYFQSGAVVRWNGLDLATTYVSASSLTAQVPATRIASAGTAAVTVYNPAPGGGVSASKTLTINSPVVNNPVPVLTGANPSSAVSGGAGFTLTVYGSNFMSTSVVHWNGVALPTTYLNGATLTAQVSTERITTAGTATITIFNPAPGGGESQPLTITLTKVLYPIYLPVLLR